MSIRTRFARAGSCHACSDRTLIGGVDAAPPRTGERPPRQCQLETFLGNEAAAVDAPTQPRPAPVARAISDHEPIRGPRDAHEVGLWTSLPTADATANGRERGISTQSSPAL